MRNKGPPASPGMQHKKQNSQASQSGGQQPQMCLSNSNYTSLSQSQGRGFVPSSSSQQTIQEDDASKYVQNQILRNQQLIQNAVLQSVRKQKAIKKKQEEETKKKQEEKVVEQIVENNTNKYESAFLFQSNEELEQSVDSMRSVTKNLEKQIEKEKSQSSGSMISKISSGGKSYTRSSALSRALDIIEKHENQEQTDLNMLREYKQSEIIQVDQNFSLRDFSAEQKSEGPNMTFSESAIYAPINVVAEMENEIDFDVGEDTALIIDEFDNPYSNLCPENFTEEQKKQWLQKNEETEQKEFENQFELNQNRFKQNDQAYLDQKERIEGGMKNQNHEALIAGHYGDQILNTSINDDKIEKQTLQTHNAYGQRYHPYGNPYDYQRRGSPLIAAGLSTATSGANEVKLSYEMKYQMGYNRYNQEYMPSVGHMGNRFVGYKNEEFDPMLDEIEESNHDEENKKMNETSSYFMTHYAISKEKKGNDNSFVAFIYVLSKLFGITFLILPFAYKQLGMLNFGIGIVFAGLLNLYNVWQMHRVEKKFNPEYVQIRTLYDLSFQCYGNSVLAFQEAIRIIVLVNVLISLNIYLGTESEQIMCQTVGGQACGKYNHLIRIAYNIMTVPIVLQGEIRGYKLIRILGFVSMAIALAIIYASISVTLHLQTKSELSNHIDGILSVKPQNFETYSQLAGFVSLCMFLFEGNSQILKVKQDMANPSNFMPIVTAAYVTYMLAAFLMGTSFYLAYGDGFSQQISANSASNLFFIPKVLLVFTVLTNYLLYQSEVFASFKRLHQQMFGSIPEDSEFMDKEEEKDSVWCNLFKLVFLSAIVYASTKVPQNINLILQLTGGLFLMILLGLFPMVIFNKTMGHANKYPWTRRFNYLLMAAAIVIGGLGVYNGVTQIQNNKVTKEIFLTSFSLISSK